MAVGLLESFHLVEEYGKAAMDNNILSIDDLIFVANAKKRKGCRSIPSQLRAEERQRVMEIGKIVKSWRDTQ